MISSSSITFSQDNRPEVVVRSPVRLDFAGGPTDVQPFCSMEWGFIVNASIDRYATVAVRQRSDTAVVITSGDFGVTETYETLLQAIQASPLKLITSTIETLGISSGIEISIKTDVPVGSGLGASSAVSIALLCALHHLKGESLVDRETLIAESLQIETGKLHNMAGGQDQYASAFGGFQSFKFANSQASRKPLTPSPEMINAIRDSLVICYSGESRISGNVLSEVMQRYVKKEETTVFQLRRLREIALAIESALESNDIVGFRSLMGSVWQSQSALHPSVSTPAIQRIFEIAKATGAIGGKAAGAGGGGCVFIVCDPTYKERITQCLEDASFSVLPFGFDSTGVKVIKN